MTRTTGISWTDATWNPVTGCTIVSAGCTNCYAMKMAARIEAMGNQPRYEGTTRKVNGNAVWTGKLAQAPESVLLTPLKRKKPTTYFVNSMGDLFHEDVPDDWIDRVFAVMALCPQHTFQVLTKRAERMRDYVSAVVETFHASPDSMDARFGQLCADVAGSPCAAGAFEDIDWPLPNVWLGVSTERQQEADERIPLLLQTPAAVRFISAEPLLGPINLKPWLHQWGCSCGWGGPYGADLCEDCDEVFDGGASETDCVNCPKCGEATNSSACPDCKYGSSFGPNPARLNWVIVGGESGPNARPMHPAWARDLRDQCKAAGVAFFFKQWGEHAPHSHPGAYEGHAVHLQSEGRWIDGIGDAENTMFRVGKKAAGRHLDGVAGVGPAAEGEDLHRAHGGSGQRDQLAAAQAGAVERDHAESRGGQCDPAPDARPHPLAQQHGSDARALQRAHVDVNLGLV